jgi:hypothetical protein
MNRYSPPNLKVCLPVFNVRASTNDNERGLNTDPVVEPALEARISSPLRAMPLVPRASMEEEVTVPDSETPTGS